MSDLLHSLQRIEKAAQSISERAAKERREIGERYKAQTVAFDHRLQEETQKKLDAIETSHADDLTREQVKLEREQDQATMALQQYYLKHHERLAEELFQAVITLDDGK